MPEVMQQTEVQPATQPVAPTEAAPESTTADSAPAPADGQSEADASPQKPVPAEEIFRKDEVEKIVQARLGRERKRFEREARLQLENQYLREQAQKLAQQGAPQRTESPSGPPTPDQFKDYESYVRAEAAYAAQQTIREQVAASRAVEEREAATRQAEQLRERLSPGLAKYDDFEDVALDASVPITAPMVAAMLDCEIPHDVAYFLGSHREEATRIAGLSPAAQVREVDKLVAALTKPKQPTAAPAPITPNASKGSVTKDPSEMTFKEFVAWRRKSIAQRRV